MGLLSWAIDQQIFDSNSTEALTAALKEGKTDLVADSIVSALRESKKGLTGSLNNYLKKEFRPPSINLPKAHRLLKEIPFSAALTTNFDDLLEQAWPEVQERICTPKDTEQILGFLSRRKFFILMLNGMISRSDTLLIAPAELKEATHRDLSFSKFMEGLFVSRTILFLGASLDGIDAYLNVLGFSSSSSRNHYALVAVEGTAWKAKASQLKRRYGIEVLPYTPSQDFHEFVGFLEDLVDVTSIEPPSPSPEITLETSDELGPKFRGIKRIQLRNIGPFVELDLDLTKTWNVLLGDNGVGKSNILRAIATAISGRDAEPYAGRLIRAGEQSASILLETTSNTYKTEIRRRDNGAEVTVAPARPLDIEGWLAVGFPPLRTVTWERPKGPTTEGRSRPTVSDILPLVKGDPDPRMDGLKQWLVNIDARAAYERNDNNSNMLNEKLMGKFFEIVERITPGVKIRFGHIDPVTHEVSIVTDDGEVPIEMISQGTISLIGWIGVLLQRFYEIYGGDGDPTGNYALVLIDEIDAHMHPEWQQSVVHDLCGLFPNVQFIATTHSPLVVGGMSSDQVMRFQRDEDGVIRKLDVTPEMTMGRADQVLTSALFGMRTTLDPETQKKITQYRDLLGKERRTKKEEEEFRQISEEIRFRIPPSPETPPGRMAMQLVEAVIKSQIHEDLGEARTALLDITSGLIDEVGKGYGKKV